ncbi:MAG: hypothetical protein FJZ58_02455 [Chlamydiae bacterium]|nr:hypothetical protein [Chlamydiota bacterium]
MIKKLVLFLTLGMLPSFANPFLLSSSFNETLSEQDYEEIQEELKTKDIEPLLDALYPAPPPRKILGLWGTSLAKKKDFYRRISKAFHHTIIDKENGLLPTTCLVKIGKGGDRCLVTYATFNGKYPSFLQELPSTLEEVGFDGFLFYRLGGIPNPSGKEVRYCGIPYAFKIFSLLEAQTLGFSKVLWIDSAFVPLRDPGPLFEWLEQEGSFFRLTKSPAKYILPATCDLLQEETGVDVLNVPYISAQVIGFDLTTPHVQDFIAEYYRLLELGTPFFSCFPEEYVFSAIAAQNQEAWPAQPFERLVASEVKLKNKGASWAKKHGYFFFQKDH